MKTHNEEALRMLLPAEGLQAVLLTLSDVAGDYGSVAAKNQSHDIAENWLTVAKELRRIANADAVLDLEN